MLVIWSILDIAQSLTITYLLLMVALGLRRFLLGHIGFNLTTKSTSQESSNDQRGA